MADEQWSRNQDYYKFIGCWWITYHKRWAAMPAKIVMVRRWISGSASRYCPVCAKKMRRRNQREQTQEQEQKRIVCMNCPKMYTDWHWTAGRTYLRQEPEPQGKIFRMLQKEHLMLIPAADRKQAKFISQIRQVNRRSVLWRCRRIRSILRK